MRRLAFAFLAAAALARPAAAQQPAAPPMVRVDARIVLVDRSRTRRVGLEWLQVGGGRIRVGGSGGDLPVSAFVELAQRRRAVSSDSRLQVATLSGSTAAVSSGTLAVGPWGDARERGPELLVTPTVLADGRVSLAVRVRQRDDVTSPYGYGASGAPVDAATTLVVRPGEEATLATVSVSERRSDAGLLHWSDAGGSRDALVVLKVAVTDR